MLKHRFSRGLVIVAIAALFSAADIGEAHAKGYVPNWGSFLTGLRSRTQKKMEDRFEQKTMHRTALKQAFGNNTLPFANNLTNMVGPVKSLFQIPKMLNQINLGNLKGIMGSLAGMTGGFGGLMGGMGGLFGDNTPITNPLGAPGMAAGEQQMCPIASGQRLMASPIYYATPIASGSGKPLLRRFGDNDQYQPDEEGSPDQSTKDYQKPQPLDKSYIEQN